MSLGFEQAGFTIRGAFDWEQRNVDTYNRNFPGEHAHKLDLFDASGAEIRKLSKVGDSEVDLVFGGPPCQGFSIGGAQDVEDERNKLVGSFARIVQQLRPKYFVMENVQGLVFDRAAPIARAFVTRVRKAGYEVVEPIQVLNAVDFGIPQRRRRVFFLGYRRDLPAPAYPTSQMPSDASVPTVWDAIGDLPVVDELEELFTNDVYTDALGTASAYASLLRGERRDPGDLSGRTVQRPEGLSGCSRTRHTKETIKRFKRTKPGNWEPISRYYRLARAGVAQTMRAGTGEDHGKHTAPRPIHPEHPRCITTREAARLHSYPDWFVFHATKWHGFRQIGNSVPPLLARAVALQIAGVLSKTRHTKPKSMQMTKQAGG